MIHTSVWRVRGLPFGTKPAPLAQALHSWKWTVVPLRVENTPAGVCWLVGATHKPPRDMIQLESGVISITPEDPQPAAGRAQPSTWQRTQPKPQPSLAPVDPWLDPSKDPWNTKARPLGRELIAGHGSMPTSPSATTLPSSAGAAASDSHIEQMIERITEARFQEVRSQVGQLSSRVDNVTQRVQQVEEHTREVAEEVKGHRNENRTQFESLQAMMSQLLESRTGAKVPRHE